MTPSCPSPAPRRRGRPRTATLTIALAWSQALRTQLAARHGETWPSDRYFSDPVGFSRDILGIDLWSRQREIAEAVRDHDRVAVSSGNKLGKTQLAAVIAVWWFCTRPQARVRLTAAIAAQIRDGVYREIRQLIARSGVCLDCRRHEDETGQPSPVPCPHSTPIDDVRVGLLPETGVVARDGREIIGRAASSPEAARGLSSPNVLVIYDESSGIPDEIFEGQATAIAGGGKMFAISNPTKNAGWFFEIFHGKAKASWCSFQVSTRENPNYIEGRSVVPGLATKEWVDEMIERHGADSREVLITIEGRFPLSEEGRIFSLATVAEASRRWLDEVQPTGPLVIGLDPAGDSGTGDESVFAPRRGLRVAALHRYRGLSADDHLAVLLELIAQYQTTDREPVTVAVDIAGDVGWRVHTAILGYLSHATRDSRRRKFTYVDVRPSDRATRNPQGFVTIRDELAECLRLAVADGLAIPPDVQLHDEILALEWREQSDKRVKLVPKSELRRTLGRSPDSYDALALSTWPQPPTQQRNPRPPPPPTHEIQYIPDFDPYDRGGVR